MFVNKDLKKKRLSCKQTLCGTQLLPVPQIKRSNSVNVNVCLHCLQFTFSKLSKDNLSPLTQHEQHKFTPEIIIEKKINI